MFSPHFEGTLLMGGDSNITLYSSGYNPSGSQIQNPSKLGTKFAKLLHGYDLVDIWREFNASKRDYTSYTSVHSVY